MRGSTVETGGQQGFSFFLHKGALGMPLINLCFSFLETLFFSESKHCPSTSDCRSLITKDGSVCHKKIIGKFYDEEISPSDPPCLCCYVCIKSHAEACSSCSQFLATFFPDRSNRKLSKSVSSELRAALKELFSAMGMKEVKVESNLTLGISSFICDFIKIIDEIKSVSDIIHNWHVGSDVALKVYSTLNDVLYGDDCSSDSSECSGSESEEDENEDVLDEDTSSSDDDDAGESFTMLDAFGGN